MTGRQQATEVVVRLTQDEVAAWRKIRALARQLKHAKNPPASEEMEKVSRTLSAPPMALPRRIMPAPRPSAPRVSP